MSAVLYRIYCDIELPERMQGEMAFDAAYQLVCDWNARHPAQQMAWMERTEGGCE